MSEIDIGNLIGERLNVGQPPTDAKFFYFVGFRIMLYCDEMHDFGEKELSKIKSKQCMDDINWYAAQVGGGINNTTYQAFAALLGYSCIIDLSDSINPFLKILILLENENFEKAQRAGGMQRPSGRVGKKESYISAVFDLVAKNISEIILTRIFKLRKTHFLELYKCSLEGTTFQNWLNTFFIVTHQQPISTYLPIAFNIDQEGSTKNTLEVWKEVIRTGSEYRCMGEEAFSSSAPQIFDTEYDLYIENLEKRKKILSYFTTNATIMDPGSGAFEQLRAMISESGGVTNAPQPSLNTNITINFFQIPILIYRYNEATPAPDGAANPDTTQLQFQKIFSVANPNGFDALTKSEYSVLKILKKIKKNPSDHIYTFYKTFGDLNQTITFGQLTRSSPLLDGYIPIFMTGDISCGMISALFSKNVITENKGTIGDGLITYLTDSERQNTIKYINSEAPNLELLADVAETRQYALDTKSLYDTLITETNKYITDDEQAAQILCQMSKFGKRQKW